MKKQAAETHDGAERSERAHARQLEMQMDHAPLSRCGTAMQLAAQAASRHNIFQVGCLPLR
jgi:hypothetical protein